MSQNELLKVAFENKQKSLEIKQKRCNVPKFLKVLGWGKKIVSPVSVYRLHWPNHWRFWPVRVCVAGTPVRVSHFQPKTRPSPIREKKTQILMNCPGERTAWQFDFLQLPKWQRKPKTSFSVCGEFSGRSDASTIEEAISSEYVCLGILERSVICPWSVGWHA